MTELKELGLQKLKLNINDNIVETIYAKEGDHKSRGLDIQILKNNMEIDTTGIELDFYAKPKDGKTYMVRAIEKDIKQGKYEVIYPSIILQHGKVESEIVLTKGEQVISTKKFDLLVKDTIATDDIVENSDDRPLLAILVEAAKNEKSRIEAENKRVASENKRVEIENQREKNESQRKSAESQRQKNEEERQANEVIRQDNEEVRQVQEQQRQDSMSEIENRFNQLETSKQQDAEVINARTSTVKNKTYDNLNNRLEDTEKEVYKPLKSNPITTYNNVISLPDNALNGQINVNIKGNTLTNLAGLSGKGFNSPEDEILINQGTLKDGVLELVSDGQNYKNFRISANLKEDTTYTYVVEIVENTLDASLALLQSNIGGSVKYVHPKEIGLIKFAFVAGKEDKQAKLDMITLYLNSLNTEGTKVKLKNLMILEGDYTNKEVNYIEDTKSVPASFRVKSVGKNLAPVINGTFENWSNVNKEVYSINNGYFSLTNSTAGFKHGFIPLNLKKDETYTVSVEGWTDDSNADNSKKVVLATSSVPLNEFNNTSQLIEYVNVSFDGIASPKKLNRHVTLTKDFVDAGLYLIAKDGTLNIKDIQVKKGDTTTGYEPYKEDIAYITAKENNKIVNLNRLPNGICDEISLDEGKLIKRTKGIFLDGSESWTTQRKDLERVYAFGLTLNNSKSMANGFLILNDNNFSFIQNWHLDEEHFYITSGGSLVVYVTKTIIDAQEGDNITGRFKNWLKEGNLIYELAEPYKIPIDVKPVQGYKNGTVIIESYIKDRFTVDNSKTINLQYPIKYIDKLLKLDIDNAKWVETKGTLSKNGQTITVDTEGTYEVYGEIREGYSANPQTTLIAPVNLNAQINSNTDAVKKLGDKVYTDADLFTAMLLQQEVRITALEGGK